MLNRAPRTEQTRPASSPAFRGRRASGPSLSDIIEDRRRGRGAQTNISGRYEPVERHAFDDGWQSLEELPSIRTEVQVETARKIITRNQSPDISFDRSINPYRGCEHGCAYCFARPTHANMGLSPGLDFETRLFVKPDAAKLLEKELAAPGYSPRTIAIGTNTDPYQPIERDYKIMREILEVLSEAGPSGRHRHQVGAGRPRHRHPRADGRARPRQGGAVGHHAGPQAGARHGAAGGDARPSAWRRSRNFRRPAFRPPS